MKRHFTRLSVLSVFLILCMNTAFAQNINVQGTVTDAADNLPLPGVSVILKGTKTGALTDATGKYVISAPATGTLVFTYIGYTIQEIPVNSRTAINVLLSSSSQELDAVVVVGYGTQRRRDLTGSIGSVKGEDIARQPVQTATQAIQGKVAGVQVIASGEPNSLPTVRLRGTGSTLSGSNPIYVVDGVITDDIRNINNADIVSMDILKDASATAIYGMRAANGVLIITTKKGTNGPNKIAYDANIGVRQATNLVDMAGANQYAGYLNESNRFYGSGSDLIPSSGLTGVSTDWYDEILRTALQQNHNLSLSGGSEKINYFLSAGLLSEEGIQKGNKYDRFTIRSNNDYILSDKLKLSSLVSYSRGANQGANFGAFSDSYRAAPTVAAKSGELYGNTSLIGNVSNPLLNIDKNYNRAVTNRVQGNFALEYKPIEGLTLKSAIGVDLDYLKSTGYAYQYVSDASTFLIPGGNQAQPNSTLNITKNDVARWIWDNTATYNKVIDKHNFTVLGGITSEQYKFNSLVGSARDVAPNQDQWYLSAGTNGSQGVGNSGDKYTRNSFLGRVNYNYDSRYFLTASIRADGTSKYGEDNRWGYFPSLAVAWNITSEGFMKDQTLFSNLKLRGSFGSVGNDNIGSSLFYSLARQNIPYYFGGQPVQGIALDDVTDRDIKWEITDEYDAGLDFAFLTNRLSGTIDYYSKKTNNSLIFVRLPAIAGDPDNQYLTNAARISNKGVEFSLNWADQIGEDWKYGFSGNVAHNKNLVEGLNGGEPLIGDAIGNFAITRTDNGNPIGSYYILENTGVFQNQAQIDASAQKDARAGDLIYKDISGPAGVPDGKIDDYDRSFSGSYQPKLTYGFNGNVGYKGFDLNFGFYGTAGSKIYNGKKAARGVNQLTDNIEASVAKDRWTPNNPSSTVPRATAGALPASTYFLEKGDFLRLNNLTLGYTLPTAMLAKAKLSNLRLYVTGQNLFTLTGYSGFTPEILAAPGDRSNLNQGVDVNTYPSTRTFAFGINLGF
jgi:TonB-linked SusC/RagA family outer membrane protein